AKLPNVKVQILPFAAGAHASMAGTFSILDFAEYPSVVSVEYPAGGLTLEEDEEISRYTLMFDDLRDACLSTHGSLALIAETAEQYEERSRKGQHP
ncbi:MAG: Scr1 family TA system antitoxin-like transcriptional regulator, partial [Umezawaea sp.]